MENTRKFIKMHYDILSMQELTPSDKIIYSLLETYSQSLDCCYISNFTISEKCGISETTVKRGISKLVKKRLISTWTVRRGAKLCRAVTTNSSIIGNKDKINQLKRESHKKELFDYDWLNERD